MTSASERIRPSIRPSIPPVAIAAACALLGCIAAESLTWHLHLARAGGADLFAGLLAHPVPIAAVGVVASAALLVWMQRGRSRLAPIALAALFLFGGGLSGSLFWGHWEQGVEVLEGDGGGRHTFEVTSDANPGRYGYSSSGRVVLDGGGPLDVTIRWADPTDAVCAGTVVTAYGRISVPRGDDAGRYRHRTGCCGSVTLRSVERVGTMDGPRGLIAPFRERLSSELDGCGGNGAALIRGIALGDRSDIRGTGMERDFRICGLSHLLAVSGSHLVVVGVLVGWAVGCLGLRRTSRNAVLLVAMVGYVLVSGLQVSAIRAAIMTFLGLSSHLFARRTDALASCSACCLVLALLNPSVVFSLSFQLSASAVLGIIVFSSYIAEWLLNLTGGRAAPLVRLLAMTLSAQLATVPVTIPTFASFPLVSPLANLVVGPLVSVLLMVSLAVLLVGLAVPAAPALIACARLGDLIACVVACLSKVPLASVPANLAPSGVALLLALFAAVWVFWPRPTPRRARVAACALAFFSALAFLLPSGSSPPSLIALDVGQGDAILVRDGEVTVLVDTGPDDSALLSALARNHVRGIDAVVITHKHDDHCGALDALFGVVPTGRVYFASGMDEVEDPAFRAVREEAGLVAEDGVGYLSVGDRLTTEHLEIEVLWPHAIDEDGDNKDSVCLLVSYDEDGDGRPESETLLSGDAESDVLASLVDEGLGQVDVIKVGHHGSADALDEGVLDSLDPSIALISVGEGNDYGHPTPEALDLLHDSGTAVFRTDRCGDITVRFDGSSLGVSCEEGDA